MHFKEVIIVRRGIANDQRSLNRYLLEIRNIPLIDAEEEVRLAIMIKQGNKKAQEDLTKANLRFVVTVARQYQNQGLSLADLIEEGNLGLMKAVKRFDESKGFKFISYGVWWIRQAILAALAEQSRIIKLPSNRVDMIQKVSKTKANLEQNYSRKPSPDEIAAELDIVEARVVEATVNKKGHLSLDAQFTGDEDNTLIDVLEDEKQPAPDQTLIDDSLKREVKRSLGSLTPREVEIITLYLGLNHEKAITLQEIGKIFNLTREAIRQIKEKAIRKLRTHKNLALEYRLRFGDINPILDSSSKGTKRKYQSQSWVKRNSSGLESDGSDITVKVHNSAYIQGLVDKLKKLRADGKIPPNPQTQATWDFYGLDSKPPCLLSDINPNINRAFALKDKGLVIFAKLLSMRRTILMKVLDQHRQNKNAS